MTLPITVLNQRRRRNSDQLSMKLHLVAALALSLTLVSPICCQQRVNCRWGSYGAWSDCDACTRTKVPRHTTHHF
ncbi:hypothetical protein XENOCAPTIV_012783 [Xenoophorus captivus]|uniref:Uncharacterized protein n=1 Tax=Xenoophorus captivus TaxID=1517983 RepID=A0ABV0Q9N6_9TELE